MAKPRDIAWKVGNAKGITAEVCDAPGNEIAEGSFWTYDPKELRRLAKWCEQAADFLESRGCGNTKG